MEPLHHTEVDGVRTVWTTVPGPLRACLTLRVGSSDETFTTSGITHLLEHLALFGIGRPGDHRGGFVDQTRTVFHVEGDGQRIQDFFGALTRQLTDLPLHRLEAERGVLQAEQANRGGSLQNGLDSWRYGAAGYGLMGLEQLGTRHVTGTQIASWSERFATRGNSVLWLSGPPPAGLRLHLPDGPARPALDPRLTILPRTPAWFTGPDDSVSYDALVPRGYPALALAHVLHGRLVDDLRSRRAVAYSPRASYQPITLDVAHLSAATDLVGGRAPEAVRPFLLALENLAADPDSAVAVRSEEIQEWTAQMHQQALDPMYDLARLTEAAWNLVHGGPTAATEQSSHPEQILVTAPEVAEIARQAQSSLLAQVPSGLEPRRDIWSAAPMSVHPRLSGRTFRSLGKADPNTIVLGPQGITANHGDHFVSVPQAETVAVLHWTDGRRVLVGSDGMRLLVEPTLWKDGQDLVRELDARWPAELVVDMGSRPPVEIPQPSTAPPPTARTGSSVRTGAVIVAIAAAVFIGLAFVLALFGVGRTLPVIPFMAFGVSAYLASRRSE